MSRKFIDWYSAVSLGLVSGNFVYNLFGFNDAVGTSFIPAWENATAYTFPVTATQMEIVSTDPADVGMVVSIFALNDEYEVVSPTVVLNGTTPVPIVPVDSDVELYRINSAILIQGTAAGTITIRPLGGGTTYAQINPGVGKTQMSILTVPKNYAFALYRIDSYCATALQNNRILTFRNQVTNAETDTEFHVAQTDFRTNLNVARYMPFVYTQKSDIQLQVKSDNGTQFVSVFGEGILHRNGDAAIGPAQPF